MPVEKTQTNEERSYKLNKLFFRRLYTLSAPYWRRKGAWKAWAMMAMLLSSSAIISVVGGYVSYLVADSTNALVAKKSIYWGIMIWTTFIVFLNVALSSASSFFSSWLVLNWRKWMTDYLIQSYMRNRTYYEIEKNKFIDNPDQRIQGEVSSLCQSVIGIPQYIVSSLTNVAVQASIILSVSSNLFWAVIVYVAVNTVVNIWLYNPTIKQNWDLTVTNANMRTKLMHVRDNAETIAFYRGERSERLRLDQRLKDIVSAKRTIIFYGIRMDSVNQILSLIFNLLPILFVVPLYLQGNVSYGSIAQVSAAAATLLTGLSIASSFIPTLSSLMPTTIRLAEIQEKFEQLGDKEARKNKVNIRHIESDRISLDHVDAQTPNGEQRLVNDLSMTINQGQHTVIVGQTGVGKSSLLRIISGLWDRGEGEIVLPHWQQLMFIPQQPYMVLTDLRSQLLYPNNATSHDDERIQQAFVRLNRPDFLAKQGGLDCIKDWRKVLSLGEQQLVAFARIVLRKPRYVFLDEATSAMDVETEQHVYSVLEQLNITFISVGHRETLLKFHTQKLHLQPEGKWQLTQQEPLVCPINNNAPTNQDNTPIKMI